MKLHSVVLALAATAAPAAGLCPAYESYAAQRNRPLSPGRHAFPLQRPSPHCRTYVVAEVEQTIDKVRGHIRDPDLYRLFVNAWPNTVDTTVLWKGVAAEDANQELAFITTGDIHAMWLRDSANQLQSYKRLLASPSHNATGDIAALYRGAINLQARYIRQFPYCNAFQPPPEARLPPTRGSNRADLVTPPYDANVVFECKYELDSLAAFLQLSWDYYQATHDAAFFAKFHWAAAVKAILKLARGMMQGTYADDGTVNPSPYTWQRDATSATETVSNKGAGNPVAGNLGLVRSFFRPSDDSTIYQYLVPANIMFSRFLTRCAAIMEPIDADLAAEMDTMANGIAAAIQRHAVVKHPRYGNVYAFEVDGFGSSNLMDDANVPSLLSIPHLGFKPASDPLYRRTRDFVLSPSNPYFGRGPVLNATGGPHLGPGMAWPMAVIMQTMTSDNDDEIVGGIKQLMGSTSGLGLIHESVNTHNEVTWTRSWFAWANGLFGQMILDLLERKPELLKRSFQA
ncbi:metal-independent alpha-mannosidase [Hirsutella rhossiliensis]|uniref:Metal-independent alpha-mannosidase n=1 Tax=Hirsutella rhossiliensis TaxID=111463 RepID=A0A9P8MWH2_9HYPO|nr:metal-independent alpha-mannosidase [Hirsutella rhossiliensis]KAH0961664.1 metal-independent alpha-mannosidase [Hirsutella rhossiliensis]